MRSRQDGDRLSKDQVGVGGRRGRGGRGLLVDRFSMYNGEDLTREEPLVAYRGREGCRVWSRGQATHCSRSGIADVGGKWRNVETGAGGDWLRAISRCIRGR